MKLEDYLLDEIKRLNRQNDLLEKSLNQGTNDINVNQTIQKNTLAICEIAKVIKISF